MNYQLLKDVLSLVEAFDSGTNSASCDKDLAGFKKWIAASEKEKMPAADEPYWDGKENGRSPESVISTLLVHMNRYAKTYSRSAIHGSDFSTQEEFIYLINLKAFGPMAKMELVKKNIQDKPTGMLTINRLIANGWALQGSSETDKRSRIVSITEKGLQVLEQQMDSIRQATMIVSGDLSHNEKMELIRLLGKLERFHHPIFIQNIESRNLLDTVSQTYLSPKNQTA
ncbi:MarR family winged helix-turn-helix transcriptional regulator [Pedobacter sp. ASV12]|uniref:MarR family winged helix-turn-helix transcriptional regulator n=1 Tax=Pedobacter sp. ASV12 TaxID=2795120 RepID=UPI0018EB052D|nr:winged helix DNA-binding protein [Pedobacter sp. ASV12]